MIDAAIIFSDILVIPQAMGMAVEIREGTGPFFPDPLRTPEDIPRLLSPPPIDVLKELDWAFKAISLTRKKLNGSVPLLGFCGAPFTLLVYMTEGGSSKMYRFIRGWLYTYPDLCHQLLQRITDVAIEFLAQQVVAGAQMLQVFESWAGELGPDEFNQFCLPYLRQIAAKLPERLKELGVDKDEKGRKVPLTVFAKGAWYALDDLCESGYDTVSLDWLWDPELAVKVAKGRVTLQGNMDPGVIYGSKEIITQKVEKMIKGFGGGKQHYIVNLGHGTQPFFDPEKLEWFLKECHRVGSE